MDNLPDLYCCVCSQLYSDRTTPRNLDCGHCICTTCAEEIIKISPECPECRRKFNVKEASNLSINHTLLRLSRLYAFHKQGELELPPPQLVITRSEGGLAETAGTCSVHGHTMFFICLTCNLPVCRDCLINDHPDQPYGQCVIKSFSGLNEMIKKSNLQFIDRQLSEVDKLKRRLRRIKEGYYISAKSWKNRKDHKRGENYEFNLNEALVLQQQASKDVDEMPNWSEDLVEVSLKMKNLTTSSDMNLLMERVQEIVASFEIFNAKDRVSELYQHLDKFMKNRTFTVE